MRAMARLRAVCPGRGMELHQISLWNGAVAGLRTSYHPPGLDQESLPVGFPDIGQPHPGSTAMDETSIPYIETYVGDGSSHLLRESQDISWSECIHTRAHGMAIPHLLLTHAR